MTKHLKKGSGGYRVNGGRKKGSKDKKPRRRIAGTKEYKKRIATGFLMDEIKEAGGKGELPLERLMRRMNDPAVPVDVRDELAKAAAPYVHAKLSSVAVRPGVSPVDAEGKPVQGATGNQTGKGTVTISMSFDNKGDIKDGEEPTEE